MPESSAQPTELKKETESEDPYAFVALRYETEPGVDPDAVMARCVTEEFAMMGFSPERILRLFQLATYAGVHAIYERRGEAFVRPIIEDVFGTDLASVIGLASDGEVM